MYIYSMYIYIIYIYTYVSIIKIYPVHPKILSFSRISPPPQTQGPVCLKRARCVTRMPCSIWPTPWMPRFFPGGEMFGWVRWHWRCPLVGWPGNECGRCIGGLEILHLGRFLLMKDGLRDKNVERDFIVDQKPTKDTCTCSC